MLPLLVVGAAALALVVDLSGEEIVRRRQRRVRFLADVFADVRVVNRKPSPSTLDEIEETLRSLLVLVPHLIPVLKQTALVLDMEKEGGWFHPGDHRLVLGLKSGRAGVITHEAMHALDEAIGKKAKWSTEGPGMFEAPYESVRPSSQFRQIAEETRRILGDQLDAYSDAAAWKRLEVLPADLAARLAAGKMPLADAVAEVLADRGSPADPRVVAEQIRSARGPFGGIDPAEIRGRYPNEAASLILLGSMIPIGVPISAMRNQVTLDEYHRRTDISGKEIFSQSRNYHRSLYEVFARLADQSLRRAAQIYDLPLALSPTPHELDAPEELLLEVEPKLWPLLRK